MLLLSHSPICWSEQDNMTIFYTHTHTLSAFVGPLCLCFLFSCSLLIYIQVQGLFSALRLKAVTCLVGSQSNSLSHHFPVTDEDTVKRYYAKFEEKFFQTCEKELAKINTFYSGNDYSYHCSIHTVIYFRARNYLFKYSSGCYPAVAFFLWNCLPLFCAPSPEKLAEAQRRFATLQNELQSSLDAQRESTANGRGLRRRKTVFTLSQQERCKHRNIKDLQLAFSEFYLSLILLQNYQVHIDTQMFSTCK